MYGITIRPTMMSDGIKALGPESEIETRDIAQLVAEALEQPAAFRAPGGA